MKPGKDEFLFKPTPDQVQAVQAFAHADILILLGPAGSGKTHVALGLAAQQCINKACDKIILSRPVVPAGEELGFLPGKLEQKMRPWLLPFHDVLGRMTFTNADEWIKDHVEIAPVAYLRGRTFSRSVAILDEAQNATYSQLKLFLTRIGHRSKLILTGDPDQSDIPLQQGLSYVASRLSHTPGVAVIRLTSDSNPRHPIIPKLLECLP